MKNLLLCAFFLAIAQISIGQYDPKALAILEAMSKKYQQIESFEANITQSLTNEVDKINEENSGKIVVKGDKFKLDLQDQEVINNGTTNWNYLPEAKEVYVDNYDPSSEDINPTKILNAYKSGYKYLYLEEVTERGEKYDVIDLVPEKRDAQYFKIRMVIAQKDKSVRSWTMYDKNGNRYKYEITRFTANINLPDSHFTFEPSKHPGVEVIDLR